MTESQRPKALVFGLSRIILAPLPSLLARAGFDVTLIAIPRELKRCRNARQVFIVPRAALLAKVLDEMERGYDLILPGDDQSLLAVRDADLPLETKLRMLPVTSERGLSHIASKIALSQVLTAAGVRTPMFAVANTRDDLEAAIASFGYPAMVKSDFGGGGMAVRKLADPEDIHALPTTFAFPALVQQYIEGDLVDCSSYFHRGTPMHISRSDMLATEHGGIGPSYLRSYDTRAHEDSDYLETMRHLGAAIDADGFTNISAIRTSDGELWFFEADMRPNVWVSHTRYFGLDPAIALATAYNLVPPPPAPRRAGTPDKMVLPMPERLPMWDLVLNRYQWRHYFEDYLQRGIFVDRVRFALARLTLRRLNNFIRRLIGLPPRVSSAR